MLREVHNIPVTHHSASVEESAVREWELTTRTKLSHKLRKIAMMAYHIHHKENRGIVREDIVNLGYKEKYAKKILYECQKHKLLVPLDGHKQGRYKEYFLSTEIEPFLKKRSAKSGQQHEPFDPSQISVIQLLVNEITQRRPTFHKPIIHVKTWGPDFDQIYHSLTREREWIVKSDKNKAKTKSFRLESRRSCTLQVYPNGLVVAALECSYRPFRLYDTDDCREFFETIGKISFILGQELGAPSCIPPTGEWLLKQYDMDITIPESYLAEKYPYIKNWYSQEGIKIKALGHVFQIYGKIMPVCGKCLRIEENVSIKEDVSLEQGIEEAKERPFEFFSAYDLLKKEETEIDDAIVESILNGK